MKGANRRNPFAWFWLAMVALTGWPAIGGGATCVWAQSGPAHPDLPESRVLAYVPARKGDKAHVVFVPPLRQFRRSQVFRLRTPRGEVVVRCAPSRPARPPRYYSREVMMTFDLEESVFHFRSPPSLPIAIPDCVGFGGEQIHEVRVNGKTVRARNAGPVVLLGARNRLTLIMSESGGE